ncbi:MAG: CpsD/CapB family tyrosine-protein kinase [Olsenella sp.]|nr:CpsD/CapB family tyrosine-protein kinase [Olsenella sp.]
MARKKTTSDRVVLQNAVKTLAANIRFSSVDEPISSLAVVSSIPSEGKTTLAVSLAQAMADGESTVLIVECDMRRRSLSNALGGIHGRHGLHAVLSGRHTIMESVVATQVSGLYFLDAEPGIPNPPDILQSKRFGSLIDELTDTFDVVIFDTPPVGTFVDAAIIGSQVDATILVVRQDHVRREEVRNTYAQLQQAGANVIGTVLNCCDAEVSSKYYGYYKERKKDTYDVVQEVPESQKKGASRPAMSIPKGPVTAPAAPLAAQPSRPAAISQTIDASAGAPAPAATPPAAPTAPKAPGAASLGNTDQFLVNTNYVPHGYDEE